MSFYNTCLKISIYFIYLPIKQCLRKEKLYYTHSVVEIPRKNPLLCATTLFLQLLFMPPSLCSSFVFFLRSSYTRQPYVVYSVCCLFLLLCSFFFFFLMHKTFFGFIILLLLFQLLLLLSPLRLHMYTPTAAPQFYECQSTTERLTQSTYNKSLSKTSFFYFILYFFERRPLCPSLYNVFNALKKRQIKHTF